MNNLDDCSKLDLELKLGSFDPRIEFTLKKGGLLLFRHAGRSFSSVLGPSLRQSVSHSFQKSNLSPGVTLICRKGINSC